MKIQELKLKETTSSEEMVSLFDYLGKPAGSKLGKQVAEYAAIRKTKYATRHVQTKGYTGKILMYPKSFIVEFFRTKELFVPSNTQSLERKVSEPQDNTLPF